MESTNNVQLLKNIAFLFFTLVFISCQENQDIAKDTEDLLLGNWSSAVYNQTDSTTTFTRVTTLLNNEYGVSFKKDAVFIERTSGWCATPPIVYQDIRGTWQKIDDLIQITNPYFPTAYQLKIVSVTQEKLIIKSI